VRLGERVELFRITAGTFTIRYLAFCRKVFEKASLNTTEATGRAVYAAHLNHSGTLYKIISPLDGESQMWTTGLWRPSATARHPKLTLVFNLDSDPRETTPLTDLELIGVLRELLWRRVPSSGRTTPVASASSAGWLSRVSALMAVPWAVHILPYAAISAISCLLLLLTMKVRPTTVRSYRRAESRPAVGEWDRQGTS
jgi:hypothetical protein